MKRILLATVASLAAALFSVPASVAAERGIQTHQLQFAKGSSGATVKGSITGDGAADYKLRARGGQTLKVKLSAVKSSPYFNVLPPGSTGEAIFIGSRDGDAAAVTLPADGEYTIRVYQMGDAKSSGRVTQYTLDVSIVGGAPVAAGGVKPGSDPLVEAAGRAGEGKFNATGKIPCAQNKGQPMGQCDFGVARAGAGTAVLVVSMPDGRKRTLMFSQGKATGADLSQADGDMTFRATKQADLFMIQAGKERYEVPEAAITGG